MWQTDIANIFRRSASPKPYAIGYSPGRGMGVFKRDNDVLVSQQDWDETYHRALNAPKHGNDAMVSQQEWDETYPRAAQAPGTEDV